MLKCASWGRSSTWLERLPVTEKVASSSLVDPAHHMERVLATNEDLFESKDRAIEKYECDNPTRKVMRTGKENSPIEVISTPEEGRLQKYLIFQGDEIAVEGVKFSDVSENIRKLLFWPQICAGFIPESVHLSELVRKPLSGFGFTQTKSYFVLTGSPQ